MNNMKKALIIIDIQNDYFEGGLKTLVGSFEASLNARTVLEKCREEGTPVVHIQHINNREGAQFFLPETDGIDIHANVKPIDGERVFIKHYPNSFRDTGLHSYLQDLKVKELVICGMMTHMCVDTTVRAAKDLGYINLLIGDACATLDLQFDNNIVKASDVQNAFLAALDKSFATVITAQHYINKSYLA